MKTFSVVLRVTLFFDPVELMSFLSDCEKPNVFGLKKAFDELGPLFGTEIGTISGKRLKNLVFGCFQLVGNGFRVLCMYPSLRVIFSTVYLKKLSHYHKLQKPQLLQNSYKNSCKIL